MNIAIYVPVYDDTSKKLSTIIEESKLVEEISKYKNEVTILHGTSINDAITEAKEKIVSLFITIDKSASVLKTFNVGCMIFASNNDKRAVDIISCIEGTDHGCSYRDTIYTKNEIDTNIQFIYDESLLEEDSFAQDLQNMILYALTNAYKWTMIISVKEKEPEESYNVMSSKNKIIIAAKGLDLAIRECNKYIGAVVKNKFGAVVYRSQKHKIDPIKQMHSESNKMNQSFIVPVNIKNTTSQNKV